MRTTRRGVSISPSRSGSSPAHCRRTRTAASASSRLGRVTLGLSAVASAIRADKDLTTASMWCLPLDPQSPQKQGMTLYVDGRSADLPARQSCAYIYRDWQVAMRNGRTLGEKSC
ncbi:hypothetical protein CHELA40_15128 [Chelatococcus asaccharovorans]|nr:hypothetical protein CHELA40_15128 [Chelatococcus asaccharovorans]